MPLLRKILWGCLFTLLVRVANADEAGVEAQALLQGQYEWHASGRAMVIGKPQVGQESIRGAGAPHTGRLRRIWGWLRASPASWFAIEGDLEVTQEGAGLHPVATFIAPGQLPRLAVGDVAVPFGRELGVHPDARLFGERSLSTLVLFPRAHDYGAVLSANPIAGSVRFDLDAGVLTTAHVLEDEDSHYRLATSGRAGLAFEGLSVGTSGWRAQRTFRHANASVTEWRAGADAAFVLAPLRVSFEYFEGRSGLELATAVAPVRSRGWFASTEASVYRDHSVGLRLERFTRDLAMESASTVVTPALLVRLHRHARLLLEYSRAIEMAQVPADRVPLVARDSVTVRLELSALPASRAAPPPR